MSSKSLFREQLERPDAAKDVDRGPSAFPVKVRIEPGEAFESPVTLAKLLRDHGLGLAGGHAAVTEMASNGRVEVTVTVADPDDFIRQLTDIGLAARVAQHATGR